MEKIKINNLKAKTVIDICDTIVLCSYIFASVTLLLRLIENYVVWPGIWNRTYNATITLWLCYAIFKLILWCFEDFKHAIIPSVMLIAAYVGKRLELCDYLPLVSLMIVMHNVSFERLAKMYCTAIGTILCITAVSAVIGYLPNYYTTAGGREGEYFYTLGFLAHGSFGAYWLAVVVLLIYLVRRQKYKAIYYVVIAVISTLIYLVTKARGSYYVIMATMALLIFDGIIRKLISQNKKSVKLMRVVSAIACGIPLYCTAINLYMVWYFENVNSNFLGTVAGRIYLTHLAFMKIGLVLPGCKRYIDESEAIFNWLTGTGSIFSSAGEPLYTELLVNDGLVVLVPFVLTMVWIMIRAWKKEQYHIIVMFCLVSAYSVLESSYWFIDYYAVWMVLFSNWNENNEENRCQTLPNPFGKTIRRLTGVFLAIYTIMTVYVFSTLDTYTYKPAIDREDVLLENAKKIRDDTENVFMFDSSYFRVTGVRMFITGTKPTQTGNLLVRVVDGGGKNLLEEYSVALSTFNGEYYDYVDIYKEYEDLGINGLNIYEVSIFSEEDDDIELECFLVPLQRNQTVMFQVWQMVTCYVGCWIVLNYGVLKDKKCNESMDE